MSVLDTIGRRHDFVPPESSISIINAISSNDKKLVEFPTVHVGLCTTPQDHEKLWPEVGDWKSLH